MLSIFLPGHTPQLRRIDAGQRGPGDSRRDGVAIRRRCARRMRQEVTRDEMDVVSAVRQGLSERIGPERYGLWFHSGVRLGCEGRSLVVAARDEFLLDRFPPAVCSRSGGRRHAAVWRLSVDPFRRGRFGGRKRKARCAAPRVSEASGRDRGCQAGRGAEADGVAVFRAVCPTGRICCRRGKSRGGYGRPFAADRGRAASRRFFCTGRPVVARPACWRRSGRNSGLSRVRSAY